MRLYLNTDLGAWGDMVHACPGRTFYHDPPWLRAVASTIGTTFEGAIVELAGGRVALLPVVTRRRWRGLLASGHSGGEGAFSGYGGLLASGPLSGEEVEAVYARASRAHPEWTVMGNPFAPAPHLPAPGGAYRAFAGTTHVVAVASLSAPPAPAPFDMLWVPGPPAFQADRFCRIGPDDGRPATFYYHLFEAATPDALGLLLLQRHFQTVAAALVGFSGSLAHLVGARAIGGDPALAARAIAQLPRYMPAGCATLDLGMACPPAAIPAAWQPVALPVPGRVRRWLPHRLAKRREAS